MSKRHQGLLILLLLVAGLLGACGTQPTPMPSDTPPVVNGPTQTEPATEVPAPTATAAPTETTVRATDTSVPPSPAASPVPTSGSTQAGCRLGGGLREETAELLVRYKGHPGLVMSPSLEMAERYFPELEGWIRVLGAPSLEELEEKAERAQASGLAYEALGYGLETGETTPDAEWQDLVGSTQMGREIADRYGKLLVMGPGFRLMSQNESSYAPMAALSDVWVLQTQVLQATALGDDYRQEVERLVSLLRSSNPDIQIWAQITLLPDRPPNAAEWLSFREAIDELVDGTYVGIYLWKKEDPALLMAIAEDIYASACGAKP